MVSRVRSREVLPVLLLRLQCRVGYTYNGIDRKDEKCRGWIERKVEKQLK